jgi:MoxR-like ATPase
MNATRTVTLRELNDLLLNLAPVRPVFIWGPPGIGKSGTCRSPNFVHQVPVKYGALPYLL